jgi:hypothetical protein
VPTEWDAEDAAPRDIVEIFVLGQAYAHVRDERALPLADELQSAGFGAEAELVRARYEIASGQVSAAFDALVRSVGRLRLEAPTLCQTASEVLRLMKHVAHGRPEYAEAAVDVLLEAPFAGYVEEDFRITTAQRLAFDLEPVEPCLRALRADRTIRWERAYLAARYSCLLRAQHHRAAEAARDQAEYQANTTGDVAEGLPPGSGGSTATGAGTTVRPSDASSRAGAPPSEEPSTGPLR